MSELQQRDDDEPLLALETPLHDIVTGEDDTFRTENASVNDWERRNVIERTRGNIHVRVDLMEVIHGTYENDADEATLMVFRFRFDPQKHSRRIIRARINVEFFANNKNDTGPTVDAIAPEERWSVVPTVDSESITRGGELNLGASGVPFLEAGGALKFEKTVKRDASDATTVTGSINLGTGKNSGESTVAVWNLQENKRRQTGVPDSVRVAVLLRREDSKPFNAKVTLEADADFVTGLERKFSKVPLDDPVLFNPTLTGDKPKKGRSYNVQDLSSFDLYSLCDVRMGVEAQFGQKA
ncbi:uncharacterized protein Triagg1_4381 [Trichoderma aggressivum f. europaeum]|uniref:Uncharacterized protein n=1 Tax=Trichoderma aggressivum f. europaeum TaxID=173218 RepID=A0AAE1M3V5_9HYPO|nr:hypothetical protein Triagg1_4381 [Trichoderma aggressivum f. europaeum]